MRKNSVNQDCLKVALTSEIADIGDRFFSLIIDYIIYGSLMFLAIVVSYLIWLLLDLIKDGLGSRISGDILLTLLIGSFVFVVFHYSQIFKPCAQSIGEKIMKIAVVPLNSKKISVWVACTRLLFFFSIILELLSLVYLVRNRKQSYLDITCNTMTIKIKPKANSIFLDNKNNLK